MQTNEAATRTNLIDPQLAAAGWNLTNPAQVRREVPIEGYDQFVWNGLTDYCLYDDAGRVIAVIEAKKTSRHPREGEEQLRQYVNEIGQKQAFLPFGFLSNGRSTFFCETGVANPRLVAGFFSPSDLNRLRFIRQNGLPLENATISTAIADRPYQHEAIRRVAESFAHGKRRALLVMATGTGKTRTTMALIELFLRTRQAQKVLFLADRDALVDQAMTDGFKAYLPHEPRVRIFTRQIDQNKRLYVATQQTMSLCFDQFGPAFFDLIVFDEAHRSIFNRFTEVIEYFDARMIGLTATPADFIDRDTFRIFDCGDKAPTFVYPYKQAVDEGFLVDFSLYKARTGFQRDGIKGAKLPEEDRNALIEQGIDPDDIDYSGSELEKTVSNTDTLRKQCEEIMEICLPDEAGQLPGKTIVFAMTKNHAERVRTVFEEMYPQHVGLVKVITSGMERVRDGAYGDGLISQFKKNDLPRIAISVDMLDTGIDVPEVVNLVFMKPVQSRIKLWQMIGRGTRSHEACKYFHRLPGGKKTEFKILDFWENDFDKKTDDRVPSAVPVLVSVFNTRLDILAALLPARRDTDTFRETIVELRAMIDRVPRDSFPVRKVLPEIEQAWNDAFWNFPTKDKLDFLRLKVGPLLRYSPNVDVAAETFTHKVERLALQGIKDKPAAALLTSIAEDVGRLPGTVQEDARYQNSIRLCLSQGLAEASPSALRHIIHDLAGQMKNRTERESAFRIIDLPDFLAERGYISVGEGGQQVHVEEYRKRVESRILQIVENHPTIEAIRQGIDVTDLQLVHLERTLRDELTNAPDLELTPANIAKAYGLKTDSFLAFLRHVLSLDALPDYSAVVTHAFSDHIQARPYTADQIRFLRSVQEVFLKKRRLTADDLYQSPFTQYGRNAVERFFTPPEIHELLAFTDQLAA